MTIILDYIENAELYRWLAVIGLPIGLWACYITIRERRFPSNNKAIERYKQKAWGAYVVVTSIIIFAWITANDHLAKVNLGVLEPWKYSLVFGIPVLIALFYIAVGLRNNRLDRRRREWSTKGPPKPGYFRLTPYQSDDRENFHRVDGAHERILSWLRDTDQILLYLTGRSGSGKSSLLNAFVIPSILETTCKSCVINVRAFDDPIAEIKTALLSPKAIWKRPPKETSDLPDLLQRALQYLDGKRLIIILDQFEEFVILHEDKQDRAPLRNIFATLLERSEDFPKLTIMLTLRDDYLAPTREALALPIHYFGKNWEQVELFVQSAASDFLRQSHDGGGLNDSIITQILEEAADIEETPGLFRPITLNMLGIVIAGAVGRSKGLPPDQVLRTYIRHRLQDPLIRDFAPKILLPMATRFKTKRPLSEVEIAKATKIPIVDIQGTLVRLERDGLVRRFDQFGVRLWEISHDFIARLVARVLDSWRETTWRIFKPWLVPFVFFAWLATLALGVPFYVDKEHERAIALLSEQSFVVKSPIQGQLTVIAVNEFGEKQLAALLLNARKLDGKITNFSATARNLRDLSGLSELTNLQRLELSNASNLTDLSALSGLTNLQTLDLKGAVYLTDMNALSGLINLQTLGLSSAVRLTDLSALSELTNLQSLDLSNAQGLVNLSALSELTNLQSLDLSNAQGLRDLSAVSGLTNLQTLKLRGAGLLTDLSAISELTSLQILDLSNIDLINRPDLSALTELINLQTLDLSDLNKLPDLSALPTLTSLKTLDLSGAVYLRDLSGLSGLTNLQTLDLKNANNVSNLSGLSGLTNLQTLDLRGSGSLRDLSAISALSRLQTLKLRDTDNLTDLSALSGLTNLQTLELSGTDNLTDLSALSGLTNLQSLELRYAKSLTDLSALSELKNLQTLELSGVRKLTNLSGLSELTNLQSLDLSGAVHLRNLSSLSGLTNLQSLDLSYARGLVNLNALSELTNLQTLDLSGVVRLRDLNALSGLTNLRTLNLSYIPNLTNMEIGALRKTLKGTSIIRIL